MLPKRWKIDCCEQREKMYKVLIIQAEMKHYRVPFFTGLYAALQRDGIELTVAYSNSNPSHALRKDSVDLPPPIGRRVEGRWFLRRFVYQSLWKEIFSSDLVIVGPEAKYLMNPILLVLSGLGLKTVAFWGLAPNRSPNRSVFAEWVKEPFFTCVDWWFAYTESVGEFLRRKGMPSDKITNVQNATDTAELRKFMGEIRGEDVLVAKEAMTGTRESRIGLYCGMIEKIKSIPLLLEAACLVKERCPEFHLVLIGDGSDRPWLQGAITNEPWIHYLGFKSHQGAALYFKMSDLLLLAGTAGLAVVDSFAASLPILATRVYTHPPEISYVIDGYNGLVVPKEARAFADSILRVLSDPSLMERLRKGAQESGTKYTMEAMVENYRMGIKRCLACYGVARLRERGIL
jgi:glycosyltransferase involved in cell wall biosynthesis